MCHSGALQSKGSMPLTTEAHFDCVVFFCPGKFYCYWLSSLLSMSFHVQCLRCKTSQPVTTVMHFDKRCVQILTYRVVISSVI